MYRRTTAAAATPLPQEYSATTFRKNLPRVNHEHAIGRRMLLITFILGCVLSCVWMAALYHVHSTIKASDFSQESTKIEKTALKSTPELISEVKNRDESLHNNPYTSDALRKNPYLGWQPSFPPPGASFSWRKCFSIRPTGPVSTLPKECREHPGIFGKAPKVDPEWIPDVTMIRTMLMYGKDVDGNPFPPPLDNELCENIAIMGGKEEDSNKDCLMKTKVKPTGPLNATTVTIDPSNHFGVQIDTKSATVPAPAILCLVYTMADAHSSRIQGMRETWAGGCDGFLAFSTESDPRIPTISLVHDGLEEYDNMWQKVRSIWKFVGKHYLEDFDWFFIGGDDLFVLPHNLKTYLASLMYKDKADPKKHEYYVGRRFNEWGETYFNSGGAGYTLSQATLRKFLTVVDDVEHCSADKHTCK